MLALSSLHVKPAYLSTTLAVEILRARDQLATVSLNLALTCILSCSLRTSFASCHNINYILTDVLSILSSCSFTTTVYNRESASSVLRSVASSFASASGSVIRTTSGTVVLTTSIPASTRPASQTGAAPQQTAAAGAALGLVGVAVGLL